MKKTTLLFAALCINIMIYAGVSPTTISVSSTAGGLSTAITNAGGDLNTITNLTVTGVIDVRDFLVMRDSMAVLSNIDLSGATISAYTGAGTDWMSNTTYAADAIPQSAFNNPTYSKGKTSLTSINLPTTATSIGHHAFYICSGLTSITIPTSVTSIGDIAFAYCSGLTSVTIPSSVISIGDYAFYDCSGLTSVTIPTSITSIGSNVFSECSGLTSVTIPTSVTSIGYEAFEYCTGLTSVTISTSVTSIGDWAFEKCRGLTSVIIPSSVISIGAAAFCYCSGLTSVTIPTSVTSIGYCAFSCIGLTSIYAYNTVPVDLSSSPGVFDYVNKTICTLHVPIGSKDAYKAAAQWQDFTNIVEDLPATVNNATASNVKVSTQNGQVVISGLPIGETITIYNLQGTLIYNQPANADIVAVSLPAHGVYVVRVGAKSLKVVY